MGNNEINKIQSFKETDKQDVIECEYIENILDKSDIYLEYNHLFHHIRVFENLL